MRGRQSERTFAFFLCATRAIPIQITCVRAYCARYARKMHNPRPKKAVPLHRNLKYAVMKLGYVATTLAYLNMQKAKRRYEEALKKHEERAKLRQKYQKEIDEYERQLMIIDDIRLGVQQDGLEKAAPLPGLQMSFVLQVGKLGGKNMSAQIVVKLRNGSDKTMRLTSFQFSNIETIKGVPFKGYDPCYITDFQNPIELEPGGGCEMEVGAFEAMPLLSREHLKLFRNWLAELADKKLYSNIPVGTLYQKAVICKVFGVRYIYQLPTGEWVSPQSLFKDCYGHIEYKGITWMPVPLHIGKIILKEILSTFTFGVYDAICDAIDRNKNGSY